MSEPAPDLLDRIKRLHEDAQLARADAKAATDERNALLLEAWEAGVDMPALGAALGMSAQAISKALGRPTGRHWTRAPGVGKGAEESSS